MATIREQRLAWIKYRGQYERRGYSILSGALRRMAARIPWGRLTEQNYQEVIRENINQAALYRALSQFYRYIVSTHTARSLRLFERLEEEKSKASRVLINRIVNSLLRTFLTQRAGNFIETMTKAYADYIIGRITELFAEGPQTFEETVREISKETRKKGFYDWQTRRIVRTETTFAGNLAAFESAKQAGIVLKKRWLTLQDERTRQHERGDLFDHDDQQGEEKELNEYFEVERKDGGYDKLLFPGDQGEVDGRQTDPSNTINCRCSLAYIPKRDADGLPIPNRNPG